MARRHYDLRRISHSARRGQPASTHDRSSVARHMRERPMRTGRGMRPAASQVRQVREVVPHSAAASEPGSKRDVSLRITTITPPFSSYVPGSPTASLSGVARTKARPPFPAALLPGSTRRPRNPPHRIAHKVQAAIRILPRGSVEPLPRFWIHSRRFMFPEKSWNSGGIALSFPRTHG